jgi:hypothetical protein
VGRRVEGEASFSTAARCEYLFVIDSTDVEPARVKATVAFRAGEIQHADFFAALGMG